MYAKIVHHLRHWLFPHHSNNFRAKLLHNTGFVAVISIFFVFSVFVRIIDSTPLHILGFTSSITIEEVVRLTNEERLAQGLAPLRFSESLADAARRKAANMLEENYWAHVSPSGKTPWVWFDSAGYRYTQAGENLAKDFGSTDRMMSAWMASPTHQANIVSDKYQDIGIAVVPGTLQGQETVLVVQLFGSTATGAVAAPEVAQVQAAQVPETKGVVAPVPTPPPVTVIPEISELKEFAPETLTPARPLSLYSEFDFKKIASLLTTGLLILVLLADALFAESRRLSRRVGKNWAHIIYINVILILVTIVNAGNIL